MPCPHKGDKTLAAHSQHLEIPCQDFPADFKQKVLLGRWYSCFREVRCLKTQLEESELNIYRMINSSKHTKHENSECVKRKWICISSCTFERSQTI